MKTLKQLFSDSEIELILEDLKISNEDNIKIILGLLSNQKCSTLVIRNIIGRNPKVLEKDPEDLEELIYRLKEYNIIHLDKVFDKYPSILNKEAYNIDSFFFIKQKEGLNNDEIAKMLEKDPAKIDEINI